MFEKLFLRTIPSVLTIILVAGLTSDLLAQGQSGSRIPDQYIVILRDSELPPGLARPHEHHRQRNSPKVPVMPKSSPWIGGGFASPCSIRQ